MSLERADGAVNIFVDSYRRAAKRNARETADWSPACLASERRFGHRAARLYPLIGVHNGVRTPEGIGTLWQAFSARCLVLLLKTKATKKLLNSETRYAPMSEFSVAEIKPYKQPKEGSAMKRRR